MSRAHALFIALLGILCALTGLWLDGARTQLALHSVLSKLHYSDTLPAFRNPDSIYWIAYTREMIAKGHWRIRFTHLDNAPYGRTNLGWAALTAWHLVAVAKVWALFTGLPLKEALLPASEWANPILFMGALLAILVVGWRTGDLPAASLAVLVFSSVPRVYFDFGFAAPDHHGWHDLMLFGTLVCLASAIRKPNQRLLFRIAGVFAGMALWVGATQQAVLITSASLGAVLALILCRLRSSITTSQTLPPAEAWRDFGIAGGLSSFGFYLLEYGPHFYGMQLEVNHPFFSVALILGGEFLCRLQRLLFDTSPAANRQRNVLMMSGCLMVLFVMAGGCIFGPAKWHVMHLPFMRRVHGDISEFHPIIPHEKLFTLCELGSATFLIIIACWFSLNLQFSHSERTALLITAIPCLACVYATILQMRWAGLAGASAAAIATVLFSRKDAATPNNRAPRPLLLNSKSLSALCIALPFLSVCAWATFKPREDTAEIKAGAIELVANMDIARIIRNDCTPGHHPPVVMYLDQAPREAWLTAFGGIPSVGSLYWDNLDGLTDQVTFFASYDENQAHEIARRRGVTHLVVGSDASSVVAYHYLLHANRNSPEIRQTLAYRLANPTPAVPNWLELVKMTTPAIRSSGIRIYRVLN